MLLKRGFLIYSSLFFLFVFCFGVDASNFYGYTKNVNGSALGNVNVSVEIYIQPNMTPSIIISNLSNSTGFFNLSINSTLYGTGDYSFKPVLIKHDNNNFALYMGQSLPDFPYDEFALLGSSAITFYLKEAATLDISGVGDPHNSNTITYLQNYSLGGSYKTGLEMFNFSQMGLYRYAYVNDSDCLYLLNISLGVNLTFCNLNLTNILDLSYYTAPEGESFYFINRTHVQRCYIGNGGYVLNCNSTYYYNLSRNYSYVGGVELVQPSPGEDYMFVSARNTSGSHIIDKYHMNFSFYSNAGVSMPDYPAGKMYYNSQGTIYFVGNVSQQVYSLYTCKIANINANLDCCTDQPCPRNFIQGSLIDGFSYNPYDNGWYFSSNVTNNMTSISITTTIYAFNYQVKDTKLGYPVKSNFDSSGATSSVRVYLPYDRNYSFMVYPNTGAFPVSVTLNNVANYNTTGSGTPYYINYSNLNLTTELVYLSGYALYNASLSEQNYTNFTIITYLLEAGNMIFKGSSLPQNMRAPVENDLFNTTTGFYNITLPASVLGANLFFFAAATVNQSDINNYYGGFKPITLIYGQTPPQFNFTLYRLIGNVSNLSIGMDWGGNNNPSIVTSQKNIKIQNSSGAIVNNAHAEIELSYLTFDGSNSTFSWMIEVMPGDNSNGTINVPLFNYGIKKMQVFSPQYGPRKKVLTSTDLSEDTVHFNLSQFDPKNANGSEITDIEMMMYISSPECSIPYPGLSCYLIGEGMNDSEFDPFSIVMGGGKLDFEIKKLSNGITVKYINVDMIASGPPDALFDTNTNSTSSGNNLQEAWRFGSLGPEIYDYIIIGTPYNESALNESANVRLNITSFYSDDNLNVMLWQQGTNTTSQLTGTDYADYATGSYLSYINGTGALCNSSNINMTVELCYKNTASNMVWFKIPHFTGLNGGPGGSAVVTSSSGNNNNNNPGGSSSSSSSSTDDTEDNSEDVSEDEEEFDIDVYSNDDVNIVANEGDVLTLTYDGVTTHTVTIKQITSISVTLTIESDPIDITLNVEETEQVDVDADGVNDLYIKLNSIQNGEADLTFNKIIAEETDGGQITGQATDGQIVGEPKKSKWWIWLIVALVIAAIVFFVLKKYYF